MKYFSLALIFSSATIFCMDGFNFKESRRNSFERNEESRKINRQKERTKKAIKLENSVTRKRSNSSHEDIPTQPLPSSELSEYDN